MNISKTLTNEGLYKFGKAAAGAVVATTILKAVGRPAFIMADKKSDPETKKYTATKEFMYQGICLLITLGMLPAFKVGGLKLTEKYLKNEPKLAGVAKKVAEAKFFGKNSKTKVFENELKKIKSAEERLLQIKQNKNPNEKPQVTSNRLKGMNAVNGGVDSVHSF
jgi:hypothetical protein